MGRPTQDKAPKLAPWPFGVDQVADLRELQSRKVDGVPAPALRAGVNVDLSPEGRPRRRAGYTKLSAGHAHSLREFGAFALLVRNGQVQRVTLNGATPTEQPLATVHPTQRMVYAEIAGRVFCSNGQARFVVSATGSLSGWGVESPPTPAASAASFGGLDAGTYKVNATFVDASGEESGCGGSVEVTIADGQGVTVAGLTQPASSSVQWVQLYLSRPNGDVLYAARRVPVGVSSYTLVRQDAEPGKALETQFCDRVPPCRLLFAYKGRLYFVPAAGDGKRLYYTVALRYGLYRRHEGFLPFPESITDAVPVADGLFVGAKKTYRLSGDDPSSMQRVEIDPFGMVEGTATRVESRNGESTSIDALWWSGNGILFRAQDGGQVTPLTRNRLALPAFERGAVMHREFNGLPQYLSVLQGAQGPNAFGARDTASAEVVRNGVVI